MLRFSDKPLSIKDILVGGIKTYKEIFSKVWFIAFLNALSYGFIFYLVGTGSRIVSQNPAAVKTTVVAVNPVQQASLSLANPALLGTLNIVGLFLSLYFFCVMMHRIYYSCKGQELNLGKSFSAAGRKFFKIVVASVLSLLVGGLAAIIAYGLLGGFTQRGAMFFAAFAFTFVTILFYFVVPGILFGEMKFFNSFKHSIQLVWGHWWHIFLTILPAFLIFSIVGAVILKFLQSVFIAYMLGNMFLYLFLFPLIALYFVYLYNDMKIRKDIIKSANLAKNKA